MPWQLREGLKRRVKGAPPKPLIENLECVSVNNLQIPSPSSPKRFILQGVNFKWPFLSAIKVARDAVEFYLRPLPRAQLGPVQQFRVKPIRTGIGNQSNGTGIRYAFICDCGRAVIKLYHLHRRLACKNCHGAIMASQALSRTTRPALQVMRLESFLAKPRLSRKTREHLTKRLGQKLTMAQGKYSTQASRLLD